jgi:hypothetical protein
MTCVLETPLDALEKHTNPLGKPFFSFIYEIGMNTEDAYAQFNVWRDGTQRAEARVDVTYEEHSSEMHDKQIF